MEGKKESNNQGVGALETNNDNIMVKDQNHPVPQTKCQFYLEGRCRFGNDCHNFHAPNMKLNLNDKVLPKKKKYSSQDQNTSSGSDYKGKQKMRTAIDVIHRIQWDDALPEELITIGYEDRFTGIQEEAFDRFSHWGDLSSVAVGTEENILAIPQHRIHYFKYRNTKIWDRDSRIDLVFGSTQTYDDDFSIENVLDDIDKSYFEQQANSGQENDSPNTGQENDSQTDDDSDDEFNIEMGQGWSCKHAAETLINKMNDEERSTHFIAIRITEPDIINKAKDIQKHIALKEECLAECCMKPGLFHITLSMIRINGEDGIQEAKGLMNELETEFQRIISAQNCNLILDDLDTFGQRVLYAKVKPDPIDIYANMYSIIQNRLETANSISSTNKFQSIPHMTILKVSRPIARLRNSKYMPSYLYEEFQNCHFGIQPINNLHLCLIDAETGSDGFYHTVSKIKFK